MNVQVVYATRYGSTREIAQQIGRRLEASGLTVEVTNAADAGDPGKYDALVIGSAVYIGKWRPEAVEFVHTNLPVIVNRPVWLFSSGPLGEPSTERASALDEAIPPMIPELMGQIEARGHQVFFGAFDPAKASLGHRLLRVFPPARKLLAYGDFREWDEIDAWADEIAHQLALAHTDD